MDQEAGPALRDWLPRTAALLVGTLALATAFIAAYVGALHQPTPRDVPVGVVLGDQRGQAVMAAVRARTDKIKPIEYDNPDAAEDGLTAREVYGVLTSGPDNGLRLTTASAASPAAAELVTQILTQAAQQAGLPIQVSDAVPVERTDRRGLVPFYLAVGYVLGGYLASTALGLQTGTAPVNLRRAGLRIATLAVYSVVLGIVGAAIVGPVLDVWHHDVPAVAAVGALAVLSAALVASAIQAWLGLLGTGIVILLLVVLGNPGSGGIYAPEFLPDWLRGMHRWNVTGLATDLIKSAVYFDRRSVGWSLSGLAVWTVLGALGLVTGTIFHAHRRAVRAGQAATVRPEPPAEALPDT
ncbi:hypothetical protein DLE60_08345 [Micromonospora globispora]|uniref:DUF3533 domain-containing protein n=1 Tax=Micromonospora globispora TaxID=1450148 RepID=A0A317K0Z6_9ACTN|nr:hypothetical protein [Micromonospora globispora]PWU46581.1 hypothetical protein DLJ46_17420 [Micromonospora globispora]PWU60937.1 hypothetical protein DLE60_08345 [Micromonospora globispora]RQW93440.1 hypothetical protein DKL51_17305 [Micromonospora globispora]